MCSGRTTPCTQCLCCLSSLPSWVSLSSLAASPQAAGDTVPGAEKQETLMHLLVPFPKISIATRVYWRRECSGPLLSPAEGGVVSEGRVGAGCTAGCRLLSIPRSDRGISCTSPMPHSPHSPACSLPLGFTCSHKRLSLLEPLCVASAGASQGRTDCYGSVSRITTPGASCKTAAPEGLSYCGEYPPSAR